MKLKEKIVIDFVDFFSTGKFDFLKLGKTKEWVINNFPDPDGFDKYPEVIKDDVWTYGNIELHFINEELFMIFSDYVDEIDGGDSLKLEKWFLADNKKLNLLHIISELNKKHIDFKKITKKSEPISIVLELMSGVELGFCLEDSKEEDYDEYIKRCKETSHNEFKLVAFSFMRK